MINSGLNVCGIYKIVNLINGKIYIGQACKIRKKWNIHRFFLRKNKHANPHLQNAWNKYGEQNFKFEVIFLCSPQDLDQSEINFIRSYNSTDRNVGYNIKAGGNSPKMSPETRKKIGDAQRGIKSPNFGKHHSEETKQKMSEAHKGKNTAPKSEEHKRKLSICQKAHPVRYWQGKKRSEEAKRKMSEKRRGRCFSEESKKKMSEAHKGKHQSEETKKKLSDAHAGKHLSKETKQKMREVALKRWANKRLAI